MIGVSRRTYKDLYTEVLSWGGMADDTAALRDLAKYAVTTSHEKRLTEARWSFMLYPTPQTFSLVGGQQNYSLHEAFLTPHYFRSRTSQTALVQIPYANILNHLPADSTETGEALKFVLQGVGKVKNQPTSASVITATSSNGADNGKTVTITGETANGVETEVLTLPNAGAISFLNILDVTKGSGPWLGTLSLKSNADAVTNLTLSASQYGRQFQQFRTLLIPSTAEVIEYNFFRLPKRLVDDNDIPDTPYPFDRIHVLDALLSLQDIMRPTATTVRHWERERFELKGDMEATYQEGLSAGAEAEYVTYIAR